MKKIHKIAERIFPCDGGEIPVSLLALSAAALSCGVVVVWLWIVHFPAALSPSLAAQRRCSDQCEKVCRGAQSQQ
jgi:hypothetical protein